MPGGSKAFGCTRRKESVRQEFSHVDDLGDGKQIAARDRRTFRRIGLCRRSATDSSNPIQSRFDCRQKVESHNVKCLDLTPMTVTVTPMTDPCVFFENWTRSQAMWQSQHLPLPRGSVYTFRSVEHA